MVRFVAIRVERRKGERVAHLRDTHSGRDLFVVCRRGRYLHWDRCGSKVTVDALAAAAARALGPEPQIVRARMVHLAESCVKCGRSFEPRRRARTVCPSCRATESRRALATWPGSKRQAVEQ